MFRQSLQELCRDTLTLSCAEAFSVPISLWGLNVWPAYFPARLVNPCSFAGWTFDRCTLNAWMLHVWQVDSASRLQLAPKLWVPTMARFARQIYHWSLAVLSFSFTWLGMCCRFVACFYLARNFAASAKKIQTKPVKTSKRSNAGLVQL